MKPKISVYKYEMRFRQLKDTKLLLLITLLFGVCVSNGFSQTVSSEGVRFSFNLSDGDFSKNKTSFRVGEEIIILTKIENNSLEPFPFVVTDENYLYKFYLTEIGEALPVGYRSDKARILSIREETPGAGMNMILDPILPGQAQRLAVMKLGDRYENLTPGSYKLRIEYKSGKIIEKGEKKEKLRLVDEVAFKITP